MRDGLNGIVSDGCAAFERRSDRPEFVAPAFNPYFTQEVLLLVSPNTEGSLQEIVGYRLGVALANSPTVNAKTRKGGNDELPFFLLQDKRKGGGMLVGRGVLWG